MIDPERRFSADQLDVRVLPTREAMSRAASAMAAQYIGTLLGMRGHVRIILATGNSQLDFLDALTQAHGLDWNSITVFHMDEYLGISPENSASFRKFLRERVAQKVQPRAFVELHGDALEPIAECERYADLLAEAPIDLVCLGIGENGHLAFNDPPVANFEDPLAVKIVKLDEACRRQQVGEGHFPGMVAVPQYALTLTIPRLLEARKMICVVPDARKAEAVQAALEGPISPACPASILRRQSHATLFLDAESAGLLSSTQRPI